MSAVRGLVSFLTVDMKVRARSDMLWGNVGAQSRICLSTASSLLLWNAGCPVYAAGNNKSRSHVGVLFCFVATSWS